MLNIMAKFTISDTKNVPLLMKKIETVRPGSIKSDGQHVFKTNNNVANSSVNN